MGINIELCDGKYTYQFQDGKQNALRYGEPWRTLTGDNFVYAMACEIESLRAELAQYKQDAERYRWLREQHENDGKWHVKGSPSWIPMPLDQAIDAAMKEVR